MPRGPKGEKRPADVIGNACHVMRIATGEVESVRFRQRHGLNWAVPTKPLRFQTETLPGFLSLRVVIVLMIERREESEAELEIALLPDADRYRDEFWIRDHAADLIS